MKMKTSKCSIARSRGKGERGSVAEGKKFLITRNNKHGVGTIKRGVVQREGESNNNYDSTHREKKEREGEWGERER